MARQHCLSFFRDFQDSFLSILHQASFAQMKTRPASAVPHDWITTSE